MDLFVQILILQLLTVNYFKFSPSLKGKNILSIRGRHAYNPFYFKKVLSDINEEVLTNLNSEHDQLSMTRDYIKDMKLFNNNSICEDERWYSLNQRRYLTGFKLHLGVNYFDEGLEPLKSFNEKRYKTCVRREWGYG
jgi:hypothetical protein